MLDTMDTLRRSSSASWLLGLSVAASVMGACSNPPDQGNGLQSMNAAAGNSALAAAGVGAPMMPGMSMISKGTAGQTGTSLQPSAAGRGTSTGSEFGVTAGAGGASTVVAGNSGHGAAGGASAGSSAGASGSHAGTGGAPSTTDITAVCMGGKMGQDSASAKTGASNEYAAVKYLATGGNQILSLKTTLLVPKKPTSMQTLFIWPGLQCNNGKDPARIGNGILQPVLTWGPSCAPKKPSNGYSSWWMSAMYVNVSTAAAGPTGCAGGDFMSTEVGDLLQIDMSVSGTAWKQTVLDLQTMKSVDLTTDLKGQVQNWATWAIEVPQGETIMPSEEVVYTQSVLTFESPVTSCQPSQRGPNDYFSAPIMSADGRNCCYEKIILRARGVPATSM